MEDGMNENKRIWVLLVILTVVAILGALWATSAYWLPRFLFQPRGPFHEIPEDIEFFYTANTVISTVNVTLSVFLLITYIGMYRKTRSEFTIGLIIFSLVILLNALASNSFVMLAFGGFRPLGLGPFAFLPDLFTFVALVVLLYLSLRY
jgi:hypothetical protein